MLQKNNTINHYTTRRLKLPLEIEKLIDTPIQYILFVKSWITLTLQM